MNRGQRHDNDSLWRRYISSIAAAVGLLNCISCSGFSQKWKSALEEAPTESQLSGAWQGTWKSDWNAHTGNLRCVVTPTPTTEDGVETPCEFDFHATWMRFLSGSWSIDCAVEENAPDGWGFDGEKTLALFGTYAFEGTINDGVFHAHYRGAIDHGTMEMRRPESHRED